MFIIILTLLKIIKLGERVNKQETSQNCNF